MTLGRSTNKSYEYRVPVVDIVSWIISSFEPVDEVLFKIDVEGVEHEIFEQLTQRGAWKLIDILVFECHRRPAPARTCHELMQSVEAAAPHLKFYQEGWQKGRVDRVGDLTGIVAHTCNLTAGGLLAGESRGFPPLNCYGSVR